MTRNPADSWGERNVGELVAEDYDRAAVFRAFGVDFCCGGWRSVREACEEAGADQEALIRALEAVTPGGGSAAAAPDPTSWPLDLLAGYIVGVHHGYVRASAPVLRELSAKSALAHAARHPELEEIRRLVAELSGELERHMKEEEEVLFPRVRELEAVRPGSERDAIRAATRPLVDDHARAAGILDRLRALSDGFTPPADACPTYRATYARLAEFEADLLRHVHLENNVLFPRAAAAEAALAPAGAGV